MVKARDFDSRIVGSNPTASAKRRIIQQEEATRWKKELQRS